MSNIEKTVKKFAKETHPFHRYASFDYCYNHFHPLHFQKMPLDMEKSCLTLGMYLASWGMYRGSGFLLKKTSVKHFEQTIEYIREQDKTVWKMDVNKYSEQTIERILCIYDDIKVKLKITEMGQKKHGTLVTKVMLGVFGIVPAFDTRFCETFAREYKGKCGFTSLNKESLECIHDFYRKNYKSIDRLSEDIYTMDFQTGRSKLRYPKAKIIDMYGFQKSTKSE